MFDKPTRRAPLAMVVLSLATGAAGCIGAIGGGPGDDELPPGGSSSGGEDPQTQSGDAADWSLRRLTLAQYQATLRALLGDGVPISADLGDVAPHLDDEGEYTTVASARDGYSQGDVRALFDSALASAAWAFGDDERRLELVGCEPSDAADPCIGAFLGAFGRRAFRRPLDDEERTRYAGIVSGAAVELDGDVWKALELAVAGIIQSPELYLPEVGEPDPGDAHRMRFTSWEMASRLSYALTGGPPDDTLLDAAEADALASAEGVADQARRLLDSDAGKTGVVDRFFAEYLTLGALDGVGKDTVVFPKWSASLAASMREETRLVLLDALFERKQPFASLFENRSTFVDAQLADLYGLPEPEGEGFVPVEIPDHWDCVGLLTMGSFLAVHAKPTRTSPTVRGRFIAQRVLCNAVPPPPDDIPPLDKPEDEQNGPMTMREKLTQQHVQPQCAGCHDMMDPPGLTLEKFDGIGAFRETDHGLELDVSGKLEGVSFDGSVGLAETLAKSETVNPCLAQQAYRFMAGQKADGDARRAVVAGIGTESGGEVRELLVQVVSSDLFRFFEALQ